MTQFVNESRQSPAINPRQLALLHVSLNHLNVSIGGVSRQARGFLVGWRVAEGVYRIAVVLHAPDVDEFQVFNPDAGEYDAEELRALEDDGTAFLESMGFMLDPVDLHAMGGSTLRTMVADMPFLALPSQGSQPAAQQPVREGSGSFKGPPPVPAKDGSGSFKGAPPQPPAFQTGGSFSGSMPGARAPFPPDHGQHRTNPLYEDNAPPAAGVNPNRFQTTGSQSAIRTGNPPAAPGRPMPGQPSPADAFPEISPLAADDPFSEDDDFTVDMPASDGSASTSPELREKLGKILCRF